MVKHMLVQYRIQFSHSLHSCSLYGVYNESSLVWESTSHARF